MLSDTCHWHALTSHAFQYLKFILPDSDWCLNDITTHSERVFLKLLNTNENT